MSDAHTTTSSHPGHPVQFPPTLWTIVLEARQAEPARAQEAIGKLCVHYREAVIGYFRIKCRHQQDAEDLTGEFMQHLLERNHLASFDPEACPRFRAYLSMALKNFFYSWCRKRNARKRGDGVGDASIEELREGGVDFAANDQELNRAVDLGIVRLVHQRVMKTLEESKKSSDPGRFEALRGFVPYDQSDQDYAQVAMRLKEKPGNLRKAVYDLRSRYVQLFRAELASTVRSRKDLDDELRQLLDLLPEAIALDQSQPG